MILVHVRLVMAPPALAAALSFQLSARMPDITSDVPRGLSFVLRLNRGLSEIASGRFHCFGMRLVPSQRDTKPARPPEKLTGCSRMSYCEVAAQGIPCGCPSNTNLIPREIRTASMLIYIGRDLLTSLGGNHFPPYLALKTMKLLLLASLPAARSDDNARFTEFSAVCRSGGSQPFIRA